MNDQEDEDLNRLSWSGRTVDFYTPPELIKIA